MTKTLRVILHGQHVADLVQEQSGAKKLLYRPGLDQSASLSVAMPYRRDPYTNKQAMAFIEGLIPEGEAVRQSLQREFSLSTWRNPFLLLEHIGHDCAGAVQLMPEHIQTHPDHSDSALVPLSEQDISRRLRSLIQSPGSNWVMAQESWSLAGAQSKFALRQEDGNWYEARGSEPTTHIIKPGINDLEDQALNEHLCLRALGNLGMPVAKTEYTIFGEVAALVVERFDRIRLDRRVVRLHQEDLCQAFSLLPDKKYESAGGPSALKIMTLLKEVSSDDDVEKFVQALIANYLLGAPNAHAKNYSLIHSPDGNIHLAPLYDIASGLPYERLPHRGIPGKDDGLGASAMSIGGEKRFGRVSRRHWRRFARENGFGEKRMLDTVSLMAHELPKALAAACEAQEEPIGDSILPQRLVPAVERLCATTLTMLERDA